MSMEKHKIITGFPCNNGQMFMIMTETSGQLTTTNKEKFEKVMKDGYIELEQEEV